MKYRLRMSKTGNNRKKIYILIFIEFYNSIWITTKQQTKIIAFYGLKIVYVCMAALSCTLHSVFPFSWFARVSFRHNKYNETREYKQTSRMAIAIHLKWIRFVQLVFNCALASLEHSSSLNRSFWATRIGEILRYTCRINYKRQFDGKFINFLVFRIFRWSLVKCCTLVILICLIDLPD